MNRTVFFDHIRPLFNGHFNSGQVDGLDKILDEWQRRNLTDLRFLAYMLATVFHETNQTMQPIIEGGGLKYLRSKAYWPWYGAGLVQVTWKANYEKFGLKSVAEATTWPDCLKPLFDGMLDGMFTGRKLDQYFNTHITDPKHAREIINGHNDMELIAGYYYKFNAALSAAYAAGEADLAASQAAAADAQAKAHSAKPAPADKSD